MPIKFGPAGLGSVKDAIFNLKKYHELGLKACEIAFTYGVYIKKKEDAVKIGEAAKKLGIKLSIHAPYWINLNSDDKKKVEQSKQRILKCCGVGTWLGAGRVVFHPGYYGRRDKKESYENIKREILELQKEIKAKKYTLKICAETTGKVNVFGSADDIAKLAKETGCGFCIDFAHILAREKSYNFKQVLQKFKSYQDIHIHFSGIEYGEKGERHHKKTRIREWKKLLPALPQNKNIVIINESPLPMEDSVAGLRVLSTIKSSTIKKKK